MRHQGFTLIELLVTLTITAIIASLSLPAIKQQLTLIKLTRVLDSVALQFRRGQNFAMSAQTDVVVTHGSAPSWCIAVSVKPCDCTKLDACPDIAGIPVVSEHSHPGAELTDSSFSPATHSGFAASTGSAAGSPGSLAFAVGDQQGKVIISNQGRIRTCLMEQPFSGYPAC